MKFSSREIGSLALVNRNRELYRRLLSLKANWMLLESRKEASIRRLFLIF